MAYRICELCSIYDPIQRMDGHPAFETSQDYNTHMWQAHGGPRPAILSRDIPPTITGAFPQIRKADSQTHTRTATEG